MKNIVYTITHKDTKTNIPDGYVFLAVGPNKDTLSIKCIRDDIKNNISNKNNSYSELTGLYWIWKNDNSEHVGLVHYRRYFVSLKKNWLYKGRHIFINKKNKYKILTIDELENELKGYDLIVKNSRYSKYTNEELLRKNLGNELWDNLNEIMYSSDQKYIIEYEKMSKLHNHINCNMFYGNKRIMDKYCEWLFDLLNKVDENHRKKYGEYYHKRELGYLSEILFGIWLNVNNIKYKYIPVVNIENPYDVDGCMDIGEFIKFLFKNILKI